VFDNVICASNNSSKCCYILKIKFELSPRMNGLRYSIGLGIVLCSDFFDINGSLVRHIKLFMNFFLILQNWPSSSKTSNIWDHQVWHLLLIKTISVAWKWGRGCSGECMLCRCGRDVVQCYCQPNRCTQSAYAGTG